MLTTTCTYITCPHHSFNRHRRCDVRVGGRTYRGQRRHDLRRLALALLATTTDVPLVVEIIGCNDGQVSWLQAGMPEGVLLVHAGRGAR